MRWRRFLQRRTRDEDLKLEIESYIAHEIDENVGRGMSLADARSAAHRKFGNPAQVRERVYEMNTLSFIDSICRDMLHGLRQLRRNPAFAIAGILILGLGIASTTVIFSIAYSVLLLDLPYPEPERLVTMGASLPALGLEKANTGAADYFDWRRRQKVFDDLSLTRLVSNFNLTGVGEPQRLLGARTTASTFSTLRVSPLIGRTFTEEEQLDPGKAESVVVLSYRFWQNRFGGDASILGRKIHLNGIPHEVLGVMPPGFEFPSRDFEIWAPLYLPPSALAGRRDNSYLCIARLKAGVSIEQARSHMGIIAANLAREYPVENKDTGIYVSPMLGEMTKGVRRTLWVLLAAVGVLFLVGCANLANLLLARSFSRAREFSIRAALGADRLRLARQFLAETLPLAAAGAAVGVFCAHRLLIALIPLLPASMPRLNEIGLHTPVLLFSIVLSLASAFLIALVPAVNVRSDIERGPRSSSRLRDALIAAEIACTVLLLVASGLLLKSFVRLRSTDPGFSPAHALSLHLAVNRTRHGDDPAVARYLQQLIERVSQLPGVHSVGIVNRLPLGGQSQVGALRFENRDTSLGADWRSASGDYFRALDIPLLEGRTFNENDTPGRPPVGIIDERLAREVFGDASPIGKRFRIDVDGLPWVEIVGVVGHLRHEGLDRDPRPQVYWPYQQRTQDRMAMVVRTTTDAAALVGAVRSAIREVDPEQALYDVRPMREVLERSLTAQRLNTVLIGTFATLALLLASVGIYGVISYLTAQRRREFGVRVALGASAGNVLRLVLKQGLIRAVVGLGTGLILSAALARTLAALLHGVSPLDVPTYIAVSALLLIVVLLACVVPAWRASRLHPLSALRLE